jgi:hypothetical protein
MRMMESACLFTKQINKRADWIFLFIARKIASRVDFFSEMLSEHTRLFGI